MSILPKKLDETYLFRLASYFCMCKKVSFRPKFLSRSKFRSCRKFKSKFLKILEPPKISAFQKFTYNVGEFLKNPRIHQFWKTWIWISKMIEISNSTEISNKTSICYTRKSMMQSERDMFHQVFLGRIDNFSGGTPFFRGGHQIFDFYKNLESKIRLPRAWSPKRRNQAKFVLQHEFMPILTPIKETWQNWRHKTNVLTTKTFTLTEKFLKKRKKSSVAHLQNSTWQTNTHTIQSSLLYIILYKKYPYVDSSGRSWEM